MSIEKERQSTERFWSTFILRHSLTSLTFTRYNQRPHGIQSNNQDIQHDDSVSLSQSLYKNRWPVQNNEVFAIGSLVHNINNEPRALAMFDLDCPKSSENLRRINRTFDQGKVLGYSIYETSHSYHVIIDKVLNIEELPVFYGKFIELFAHSEQLLSDKEYFLEIGNALIKNYNDVEQLDAICHKLLDEIQHNDENKLNKKKFIIDLRWIAHSLLEYIRYKDTKKGSFAFLRVSAFDGEEQPQLREISRVHCMINGQIFSSSLDD